MKALVVFDSFFGNTEQIAQAIGNALRAGYQVETLRVGDVKPEDIGNLQLLIVGSPTRGFRPTPAISTFVNTIPALGLRGVEVAAFDTRIDPGAVDSKILPPLIKLFGFAAKPIAEKLQRKSGHNIVPPEGFFVEGEKGPLKSGEVDRAAAWATLIASRCVVPA